MYTSDIFVESTKEFGKKSDLAHLINKIIHFLGSKMPSVRCLAPGSSGGRARVSRIYKILSLSSPPSFHVVSHNISLD